MLESSARNHITDDNATNDDNNDTSIKMATRSRAFQNISFIIKSLRQSIYRVEVCLLLRNI